MSNSVQVRDYMLDRPVTVSPDMTIAEASQIIITNKISGAVVVDADNKVVGMLSELDCLRNVATAVYNEGSPGGTLVRDVMTKEVEVNHPSDDIVRVAESMLDHKHRRRPVVVNGKLVGQLTCRQLLKAIKDFGTVAAKSG